MVVEEKEPEMPWSQITFLSCHTHTVVALMSYFLYLFFPWEVKEKGGGLLQKSGFLPCGTREKWLSTKSTFAKWPIDLDWLGPPLPNCGLGLSLEMSKKLGGKEEKKIYSLIQHYSILNTLERKGFTANTFVQPEYLFSSTTQTCESGILHLRNCLSS